jgi:Protein of unknown function (DUF2934)
MDTLQDSIRRRAYEIWEQAGRSGDPEDHWLQAEHELTQGLREPPPTVMDESLPTDPAAAADSAVR